MKRFLINISLIVFFPFLGLTGEKPDLQWKTLTEGIIEAKKMDKKLLLDVYTDWCGWCKKLDREVYGNETVAVYLNKHYVLAKLNAESTKKVTYKGKTSSEMALALAFGVRGYPTIIFFDSDGEVINSLGGFVNAEKFLPVIQYIGEDHYKKMSWEEYKKKGN